MTNIEESFKQLQVNMAEVSRWLYKETKRAPFLTFFNIHQTHTVAIKDLSICFLFTPFSLLLLRFIISTFSLPRTCHIPILPIYHSPSPNHHPRNKQPPTRQKCTLSIMLLGLLASFSPFSNQQLLSPQHQTPSTRHQHQLPCSPER